MKKVFIIILMGLLFTSCSNNISNPFDTSESDIKNSFSESMDIGSIDDSSEKITTYTMSGKIIDEEGGAVSGVKLNLILDSNIIATTETNENGEYYFENLENGTYTLKIMTTPFVCDDTSPNNIQLIVRDKNVKADPIKLIEDKTSWGGLQ